MRFPAVLLIACGCGRIGFAPTSQPELTGDGPHGDSVAPRDVVPPDVCGTTIAFADTFDAPTKGASWTIAGATNDATVTQGGGALTISFAQTIQQNVLAGYQLASSMSFANTCVTVDLAEIPNPATNATVIFSIGSGNVNVRFMESLDELQSLCESSSNSVDHLDVRTYDASAHRYLRLRNSAAGWSWDVSPDNITFNSIVTNPCPAVATTNVLNLLAGASAGTSGNGDCKYGAVTITN